MEFLIFLFLTESTGEYHIISYWSIGPYGSRYMSHVVENLVQKRDMQSNWRPEIWGNDTFSGISLHRQLNYKPEQPVDPKTYKRSWEAIPYR